MIDDDDPRERRPEASRELDTGVLWIQLNEDQAEAMAGGYVPRSVKSILRELLDYELEYQRCADRPVPKPKRKKAAAGSDPPGEALG